VRFGVVTAVTLKNLVFWDMTACNLVEHQHSGGTSCLHVQSRSVLWNGGIILPDYTASHPWKHYDNVLHSIHHEKIRAHCHIYRNHMQNQSQLIMVEWEDSVTNSVVSAGNTMSNTPTYHYTTTVAVFCSCSFPAHSLRLAIHNVLSLWCGCAVKSCIQTVSQGNQGFQQTLTQSVNQINLNASLCLHRMDLGSKSVESNAERSRCFSTPPCGCRLAAGRPK
jgi:hypothetical protein